jgi:hypothetical protein
LSLGFNKGVPENTPRIFGLLQDGSALRLPHTHIGSTNEALLGSTSAIATGLVTPGELCDSVCVHASTLASHKVQELRGNNKKELQLV